jgi:hypothetical protein
LTAEAGRTVAVVIDGPRPPAWQIHALELLARSPLLEVSEVRLVEMPGVSLVSRAHRAIEQHLFKSGPDPLAPVDFEPPPTDGRAAELTVWLAASDPPREGSVLELTHGPYGEHAEPAFRRAITTGDAVVVAEARLLEHGAPTKVVARAVSGVRPFSLASGLNLALWRSATLARRAAEVLPGLDEPVRDATHDGRRGAAELPVLVRLISRWGRVLVTRLFFRRPWRVLVRESRSDISAEWGKDHGLVRWRGGHSYADPILYERDGRHHLFVEDVPPGSGGRGLISHVELDPGGGAPSPVAVLEATLLEHDGRWWMFASVGDLGTTLGDELHLFLADTPLGPWTPHPRNPVVSDVRCGRAAGAVFRDGDRLIRPAQDGSRRYGWAVSLREIVALTPERYEERELTRLEPTAVEGARAVHTYTRDSRFEAIDARQRVWRIALSPFAVRQAARQTARPRG